MSDFTRKIIDGARSGLTSLVDQISADETPLSHVAEERLAAEVEARKAGGKGDPSKNPRARYADGSSASRAQRAAAHQAREKRIHADRDRRARAEQIARDAALRDVKAKAERDAQAAWSSFSQDAASASAGRRSGPSSSSRSSNRQPPSNPFAGFGKDPKIVKHYKTLDLAYGAEFPEVKKAYRTLMRKYHPDRFQQNPKKQKAATELSMQVTQAYNELEKHLKAK